MEKGNNHSQIKLTLIYLIGLMGVISVVVLGFYFYRQNLFTKTNLVIVALLYLASSKWAATLPSGSKYRPAIVFVLFGMLIFPIQVTVFVPIPGLIFLAVLNKEKWWNVFITIGHLTLGIYAGGLVYHALLPNHLSLPTAYPAIILALLVHFIVNRIVAAFIVSFRKKIHFIDQWHLIKKDFNWTYLTLYLLAMQMVLIFNVYYFWGVSISILLLVTIYNAVNYFNRYKVFAKKAFTDALTGAENRAAWELFVDEINLKKVSGSLMMIDLDNFKKLNDKYGHHFGDKKLKEFVEYLQSKVTREHRLFRYGGDEFVIYLYHDSDAYKEAREEIKCIIDELNQDWKDEELNISISSGITQILPTGHDIGDHLKKADQLMYNEKNFKKQVVQ